jgi:hypothetical protein
VCVCVFVCVCNRPPYRRSARTMSQFADGGEFQKAMLEAHKLYEKGEL